MYSTILGRQQTPRKSVWAGLNCRKEQPSDSPHSLINLESQFSEIGEISGVPLFTFAAVGA